jgi:molybdate transport system regulatory protein
MPIVGALKVKAQILCGEEFAIGPGKADLLEAIAKEGSISAAGRVLGMSYRRSWLLVDTMNRCWTKPLVETTAGGGKGKGARLTPLGREVLKGYRALEASLMQASGEPFKTLTAKLLSAPRPSQHPESER